MVGDKLCYRGAKEICTAIGLNWKRMTHYVDERNLPAFKIDGVWLAIPSDLTEWLFKQKKELLK